MLLKPRRQRAATIGLMFSNKTNLTSGMTFLAMRNEKKSVGCFVQDAIAFILSFVSQGRSHPGIWISVGLLFCGGIQFASSAQIAVAQTTPTTTPTEKPIAEGICPAQLGTAIDAIADRPNFRRSQWGILIETLSGHQSQILYSRNAERYFIPASNAKLLTSAAALQALGSQFRIRTSVYGRVNDQRVAALRVVGRGDPTLSEAQLRMITQQLRVARINRIDSLIADDSYFGTEAIIPSWEWEDVQAGYGAPVNSLIFNQNAIDLKLWPQGVGEPLRVEWSDPIEGQRWRVENHSLTVERDRREFLSVGRDFVSPVIRIRGQLQVGSEPEEVAVAVIDPANRFLQTLRRTLEAEGISIGSAFVSQGSNFSNEVELAAIESPPLSQLLVETNQESNNLYAEVLLRSLATKSNQTPTAQTSTAEIGLSVLETTLTQLGVEPDGYQLVDGSGLSRQNLVSPQAIVQTLKAIARSPLADIYRASLPVAGVSGTLANRLRNSSAEGMIQAKTGTLTGVSALSGYGNNGTFEPFVFSIIINHSDESTSTQRRAIDEIMLLLMRLQEC